MPSLLDVPLLIIGGGACLIGGEVFVSASIDILLGVSPCCTGILVAGWIINLTARLCLW